MVVVLALNSGSSSLKYGLYAVDPEPALLVGGTIETPADDGDDHARFFDTIESALKGWPTPTVIGHRIVHGGPHRAGRRVQLNLADRLRRGHAACAG